MLSEQDGEVLALAAQRFKYPGAKVAAIKERFGVSETVYYQWLNRLLDDPAALAHDPQTVNRLRRLREARRSAWSRR